MTMKLSENPIKKLVTRSRWTGLMLVIVAAATLEATALIQYFFSSQGIREEATKRAEGQLESTQNKILDVINQTEAAVSNNIWVASLCLDLPDSLSRVAELLVRNNPVVIGSTVALVPGYNRRLPLYSPYALRDPETGNVIIKSLATAEYDYPSQEWFTKPIENGAGYWSEPYIDEGGGEVLMTTYSVPLRDRNGKVAAVLTADISLDWLTDMVGSIKVYPNAFSMVVSRKGQIMVCPAESLVMKKTFNEATAGMEDSTTLKELNHAMLSGQSGNMAIHEKGISSQIFFSPVRKTGWSLSIVIPDKEIYGGIKRIGLLVTILQLLGIAMLVLILRSAARDQKKLRQINEKKDRMENELRIGHDIQMSMIPKIFPPFPERKDIDMSASIVTAKEVGGDLYDYFIKDEKLIFCIGDVSGKGVPASLVMAVTRSLFRTVSCHEDSPARIVTLMNDSMSDMNDSNMFVTLFCGILDLQNGHLSYCNAGHNAPFILSDAIATLDVVPNLPLGVMQGMVYREQETDLAYDDAIFLYTDGLTEAENANHDLFGEARVETALHGRKSAHEHLEAIQKAVGAFVGDAPQSDDLTMLFIHYLNGSPQDEKDRKIVLSNDISEISKLEGFVGAAAETAGLDAATAMSLNLAIEEAVTNVILYAYPKEQKGEINLESIVREHALVFILSDSGTEFDPTKAPDADTALGVEDRPIGGLGIHLVRNIMDAVSYSRTGSRNILTMTKKF